MRNFLTITKDIIAYLLLFIVFYTLRIVKTPFPNQSLESWREWNVTQTLITTDLMLFIGIVVLFSLWLFIGLWWLLIGFGALVVIFLGAALFFKARKWNRNNPNYWSWRRGNNK